MIVRTYGRRKTGGGGFRSCSDEDEDDDVFDPFRDPLLDSAPAASAADVFAFSSQDPPALRKPPKRQRKDDRTEGELGFADYGALSKTATLMETQEVGEMMEHVDEVNFALDGLRKGQPARIRRASLVSLLRISGSSQNRRLLRSHGMAKDIINSIMGLSFDDLQSNIAAATLFYIWTSDGQDEQLLELPSTIRFLMKLLKPVTSAVDEGKLPKIGSKLLRIKTDAEVVRGTSSKVDCSSITVMSTIKEILGSCKEMKSTFGVDCALGRPELCSKWIALLTMEKASVSTISLEESSGLVRKSGGHFKEKLREFGGLDAVFDIAMNCHSVMEDLKESGSSVSGDARDGSLLESLVLLLKCLKIMENATFLSKDNQDHLLKMRGNSNRQGFRLSFPELILNFIKILSGLSLRKKNFSTTYDDKSNLQGRIASELASIPEDKADEVFSSRSFREQCSRDESSTQRSSNTSRDNHGLPPVSSSYTSSFSEMKLSPLNGSRLLKNSDRAASGSCGETSNSSSSQTSLISNGLKNFCRNMKSDLSESSIIDLSENGQDPFAFDEHELEPSKWEILSGNNRSSRSKNGKLAVRDAEDVGLLHRKRNTETDGFDYPLQESNACESQQSQEASCSGANDEESLSLLDDCLLTAIKVLMNLTNDNVVGCQQIAACGGLEALASTIADHFPSFSSSSAASSSSFSLCEIDEYGARIDCDHRKDNHLNDQEMDLLVAILGLLVNMVEKDESNRYRLARGSVILLDSEDSESEGHKEVIPMLCAIFLANRGDSVVSGEENDQSWDPESLMEQGEKEAEKMIVEAYAALLLAFLSKESKKTRDAIAGCLPSQNLAILVPVLERFVAFHLTLDMMTPETHKAVSEVIESCRIP